MAAGMNNRWAAAIRAARREAFINPVQMSGP
jgi:hypothetical protein